MVLDDLAFTFSKEELTRVVVEESTVTPWSGRFGYIKFTGSLLDTRNVHEHLHKVVRENLRARICSQKCVDV
jgi:hypothetical protein